ncbi:hypothetical protein ABZ612_39530 [Streptomyces avermitilis]|uniref:hypothetical protein n=1 Tax=Streptomyces avermitilis TaxID=33903 RepID=UPI0033EACE27
MDQAVAGATTPDIKLITALAAVHAARPKMIRTMQLDDVDLGNGRITVAGHVRPLDDLTRQAVLDWLDHRQPTPADRPEDGRRTRAGGQALDHPGHPQPHRDP